MAHSQRRSRQAPPPGGRDGPVGTRESRHAGPGGGLDAARLDPRRLDALLMAGVAAAQDGRRDEAMRVLAKHRGGARGSAWCEAQWPYYVFLDADAPKHAQPAKPKGSLDVSRADLFVVLRVVVGGHVTVVRISCGLPPITFGRLGGDRGSRFISKRERERNSVSGKRKGRRFNTFGRWLIRVFSISQAISVSR